MGKWENTGHLNVSKIFRILKTMGYLDKGRPTVYHLIVTFNNLRKKAFGNSLGKRENIDNHHFPLFLQRSSIHIRSKGERMNCLPQYICLNWRKIKASEVDKPLNRVFCLWCARKQRGKRRKYWLLAFSPFPTMFFKQSLLKALKLGIVRIKC